MPEYMYHWTLWNKHATNDRFGPYIMRGNARITDPETIAKNMFTITRELLNVTTLLTCTNYELDVSFLPSDYKDTDKKIWIQSIRNHFDLLFIAHKKILLHVKTPA